MGLPAVFSIRSSAPRRFTAKWACKPRRRVALRKPWLRSSTAREPDLTGVGQAGFRTLTGRARSHLARRDCRTRKCLLRDEALVVGQMGEADFLFRARSLAHLRGSQVEGVLAAPRLPDAFRGITTTALSSYRVAANP